MFNSNNLNLLLLKLKLQINLQTPSPYGPHMVKCLPKVICSCHSCSSTPDFFLDDGRAGRKDGTERRKEKYALRARTPASSLGDRKKGGVLSRVITSIPVKQGGRHYIQMVGTEQIMLICGPPAHGSPLTACIWIWRSVRLWSTRSSLDAHGGNTSAFWESKWRVVRSKCFRVCDNERVHERDTCSSESSSEESVPVLSLS